MAISIEESKKAVFSSPLSILLLDLVIISKNPQIETAGHLQAWHVRKEWESAVVFFPSVTLISLHPFF